MKNKNATFGKSLDNLTENQFHFLKSIRGGGPIVVVHLPTRISPACLIGYHWDSLLGKCVPNNPNPVGISLTK
jgi:hypothetical protein